MTSPLSAVDRLPLCKLGLPVPIPSAFELATLFFLRSGLTYDQIPLHKSLTIDEGDCLLRFRLGGHLNKTKSSGPPRIRIGNDFGGLDCSCFREKFLQIFF